MMNSSSNNPGKGGVGSPYPPNHPLSGSKHLCSICGDGASGRHYGVYSCEGCKGFFKRTVRKDLSYACREEKRCLIDKRQRNRCRYCRYQKCLTMGMKREAVQEERQRTKEREREAGSETPADSCTSSSSAAPGGQGVSIANAEMTIEHILEAERCYEQLTEKQNSTYEQQFGSAHSGVKHVRHMIEWARLVPHFKSLPIEDQALLLRAGWNELLIAAFSHRSIDVEDAIVLTTGLTLHKNSAQQAGLGPIFERVLTELVHKMKYIQMDKAELGCLRAVILFNPEVRGLKMSQNIDLLREKVYTILDEYTRLRCPDQPGRFAKLLLRLPALRSIGLKCNEHMFFFHLLGDTPLEELLNKLLREMPDPPS